MHSTIRGLFTGAGIVVVVLGLLVAFGLLVNATADNPMTAPPPRVEGTTTTPDAGSSDLEPPEVDHSATGLEGGDLPEGTSPFDTHLPGIANLDPQLLAAVQQAARDAREDGVRFVVTSGWRSMAYQQQLLDEAIAHYGSEQVAREFVATPETSSHISGGAVDIGPTDATSWLSQHGARYGLCQTYANEIWHFELATEPGGVCPPMLPNASVLE